jgi:hypothetical protein
MMQRPWNSNVSHHPRKTHVHPCSNIFQTTFGAGDYTSLSTLLTALMPDGLYTKANLDCFVSLPKPDIMCGVITPYSLSKALVFANFFEEKYINQT